MIRKHVYSLLQRPKQFLKINLDIKVATSTFYTVYEQTQGSIQTDF